MRTPEPCWLIDPHPACAFEHTHCPGLRRARAAPAGSRAALPAPPAPGRAGRRLPGGGRGAERRGWRPGRGHAQSGRARRGDEPARCGHARSLGERPLSGDPGPFGPASPGRGQTPPLGPASPRGSAFSCGSIEWMPRPASAATLFPALLSLPRPLSLWSFPSQMGFRRPPFSPDFIFLFPNHICRPALWKLCQRREISSWLVSTPNAAFSQHTSPITPPEFRATSKTATGDTPAPSRL